MKTKNLVALVILGNLAGAALTSFFALTYFPSSPPIRFLCQCGWVVFAFPLGWVGVVAGKLLASRVMVYLAWGAGAFINACLWGWTAGKINKAIQGRIGHAGFDASVISPRIAQLRHEHAAAAHARSHPVYSRKGLLAAARRTITRCGYFSNLGAEHPQPAEGGAPKHEP